MGLGWNLSTLHLAQFVIKKASAFYKWFLSLNSDPSILSQLFGIFLWGLNVHLINIYYKTVMWGGEDGGISYKGSHSSIVHMWNDSAQGVLKNLKNTLKKILKKHKGVSWSLEGQENFPESPYFFLDFSTWKTTYFPNSKWKTQKCTFGTLVSCEVGNGSQYVGMAA